MGGAPSVAPGADRKQTRSFVHNDHVAILVEDLESEGAVFSGAGSV
jgi:hypothetical protein